MFVQFFKKCINFSLFALPIVVLAAVALFTVTLSSCHSSRVNSSKEEKTSSGQAFRQWSQSQEKIRVLSTTRMIDDLVGEIGKDKVAHIALILGESDPHRYELVKGDDEKFALADLVFYNGLGLEHGASLIHKIQEHPATVSLGDAVGRRASDQILMAEGQPDPHIWMDISIWAMTVDEIVKALGEIDPDSFGFYQANGQDLQQRMRKLDTEIQEQFQRVPQEKRFFVTSHDAFHYFTRRYLADPEERKSDAWKERFAAPEGLAPEGQLSVTDIQWIMGYIQKHQIHVVFPESNVSRDSLKKIISGFSTSSKVRLSESPLYGDAMGSPGSSGESYLKMMQHNAQVVIEEILRGTANQSDAQ